MQIAEVIELYKEAYNQGEMDLMHDLLSADVEMTHHNRGIHLVGRDQVIAAMEAASGRIARKRLGPTEMTVQSGGRIAVTHTWSGTATTAIPGLADEGKPFSLDLCSIFTVRDGQVLSMHDYGG